MPTTRRPGGLCAPFCAGSAALTSLRLTGGFMIADRTHTTLELAFMHVRRVGRTCADILNTVLKAVSFPPPEMISSRSPIISAEPPPPPATATSSISIPPPSFSPSSERGQRSKKLMHFRPPSLPSWGSRVPDRWCRCRRFVLLPFADFHKICRYFTRSLFFCRSTKHDPAQ